jgi:hypothetical protein
MMNLNFGLEEISKEKIYGSAVVSQLKMHTSLSTERNNEKTFFLPKIGQKGEIE